MPEAGVRADVLTRKHAPPHQRFAGRIEALTFPCSGTLEGSLWYFRQQSEPCFHKEAFSATHFRSQSVGLTLFNVRRFRRLRVWFISLGELPAAPYPLAGDLITSFYRRLQEYQAYH